ncbi:MAG: hypothetical protein RL398_2749, partial [Planctomycetota bacterium]
YGARLAMTLPCEPTVPAARLEADLRRFELRRLRVSIGAKMASVVVPDAQSYLRSGGWVDDAERQHEPPYWVQVWPASLVMSRWLAGGWHGTGRRALDLGCGLGLPGITAASLGAQVTFLDRNPDALRFARWNAAQLCGEAERVSAVEMDWGRDTLVGSFDVILLADVTYRPLHHAGVLRHLRGCLAEGGVVLHAEPWRAESTGFLRSLAGEFAMAVADCPVQAATGPMQVRLCAAARDASHLQPWLTQLPRRAVLLDAATGLRTRGSAVGAAVGTAGSGMSRSSTAHERALGDRP